MGGRNSNTNSLSISFLGSYFMKLQQQYYLDFLPSVKRYHRREDTDFFALSNVRHSLPVGLYLSMKTFSNLILTILYVIKPTKILTAALHMITGYWLVHSFKLVTIFEDIITCESSKVIHSSLKALKLQGWSRLLLLWEDDRTLHRCLKYKVTEDKCFFLPVQGELLFIAKVDYVASIWVTNRCNSFHAHSISNFFQHHRSQYNYKEDIQDTQGVFITTFAKQCDRLIGMEKSNHIAKPLNYELCAHRRQIKNCAACFLWLPQDRPPILKYSYQEQKPVRWHWLCVN